MGRYILTPEIFMFLEQQHVGAGGEIQLTDAIQSLNEIQRVFAYDFEGKRYDVGEKLGFVQTTIEMALQHPELRDDMVAMMKKILEEQANQESYKNELFQYTEITHFYYEIVE